MKDTEIVFPDYYGQEVTEFVLNNTYYSAPSIKLPDDESNQPELLQFGMHITEGKYLEMDGLLDYPDTNYLKLFGLWIYHVDGILGEVVNLDFRYGYDEYAGFLKMYTTGSVEQQTITY